MAKISSVFVCNECGYESAKWLGKCPGCNSWNSFYEEKMKKISNGAIKEKKNITPVSLNTVKGEDVLRTKTGYEELDRVLGGGIVKGSLILLGGEPGIGKSTLILQLCQKMAKKGKVLYVSGEESASQIKIRADRLGISDDNLLFLGETDIKLIEEQVKSINPELVIIDSIQTMYSEDLSAASGSVSQVREVTSIVMRNCKEQELTTIVIGHVTKDGTIAGPRVLEHMVDTVLYLEGERYFSYRILRTVKNRFGSTNEIGVFEMQNEGLTEIDNISSMLLSERQENSPGSVVVATIEGTRPLLVEIQALTSTSVYGLPKRTANGIEYNRLAVLIAVLEKRLGLPLGGQDVYLNVVGGLKISEPAIDLGVIISCISSYKNINIPNDLIVMGEVGLTGEIRSINLVEKRIKEAEKLGFKTCIIPESNKKLLKEKFKLDIIGVKNITEILKIINK